MRCVALKCRAASHPVWTNLRSLVRHVSALHIAVLYARIQAAAGIFWSVDGWTVWTLSSYRRSWCRSASRVAVSAIVCNDSITLNDDAFTVMMHGADEHRVQWRRRAVDCSGHVSSCPRRFDQTDCSVPATWRKKAASLTERDNRLAHYFALFWGLGLLLGVFS